MTLEFFVNVVPPTTTHQSKKIIRAGKFRRLGDTPQLQHARGLLEEVLLPHQPATPVLGPVRLELTFTWPWLAGATKRTRALGRIRRTTKPDCSNLAKTLEDRLASLRFIEDDALVCELQVSKWFGDQPGIGVRITPLGVHAGAVVTPTLLGDLTPPRESPSALVAHQSPMPCTRPATPSRAGLPW